MISIKPIEYTPSEFLTHITCPCGAKVRRVGLRKGSRIEGLTFFCDRCKGTFEVTTE